MQELSVIRKTYDLVTWYVPIVNKLPRDHKFALGDRVVDSLYGLLEGLVAAAETHDKAGLLAEAGARLTLLRYQTRLLKDFNLLSTRRYEHVSGRIAEIGAELGGWLRHARGRPPAGEGARP